MASRQRTQIVQRVISEFDDVLGDNSKSFLGRVYNTPRESYINRLRAIGFVGLKNVLDAGCGFGQWTLEMAHLNEHVSALDIASDRLIVLRKIAQDLAVNNIDARMGILNHLPYEDNSHDAIFCYSALFLTPWKESLKEFSRVLKENGKLYLNANGLGWYLHLWKNSPNKGDDYDPRESVAQAFRNTLNYQKGLPPQSGTGIITTPEEMGEELVNQGFEVLGQGGEGTINLHKNTVEIKPNFQGTYEGETGVFEFLAVKQ